MKSCRRVFIIHVYSSKTNDEGYLRVIARVVASGLLLSCGIRKRTCICIETPKLSFVILGSKIGRLYSDDSSSTGIIRRVIQGEPHTGILFLSSCSELNCKVKFNAVKFMNDLDTLDLGSISYPLCLNMRITQDRDRYVVEGLGLEPWYVVTILNITLDNLGIDT